MAVKQLSSDLTKEPHHAKIARTSSESHSHTHYSYRTEQTYIYWIKQYIFFHGKRHPAEMGANPLFSWVQITNDTTILGEELRRERKAEAIDRAGKILLRLLEFIGYYTYVHKPTGNDFADYLARIFREPSFSDWFKNGLKEGPTRWILAKYPFACSKCGGEICHCLLDPGTLENRREDPERFEQLFKDKADEQRAKLLKLNPSQFTLRSMIDFFKDIYRANYYHQDLWKIGMHLSEELGEATIELSRLELRFLVPQVNLDLTKVMDGAFLTAKEKLIKQRLKITTGDEAKRKKQVSHEAAIKVLEQRFQADLWGTYDSLVGEKLKEEIADVLSWLSAIIFKLDESLGKFTELPKRYQKEYMRDVWGLMCPWCFNPACDDHCLVSHAISSEIVENVSKF
jgi:hypothetical protein